VVLAQEGDRLRGVEDETPLARTAGGDVRVHIKAEMVRRPTRWGELALAFAPFLALPTGDEAHFAGAGTCWGEVRLAAGLRGARGLVVSTVGVRVRKPVTFYGARYDTAALAAGLGARVVPWRRGVWQRLGLLIEADVEAYGLARPAPAEVRAGVRWRLWPGVVVGLAGGAGLGREPGTPPWRGIFELAVSQHE